MLRSLPGVLLALALPLAASGQITHAVTDGVWFIDGTDGPDTAFIGCNGGSAQVNDTDPVSGPIDCSLITRFEVRLGDGPDFGLITDVPAFGLDPVTPSTLDGGPGHDFFQFDLSDLTENLTTNIATASGGGLFDARVQRGEVDFFRATILDNSLGVDLVLGSGNDLTVVEASAPGGGFSLQVFGGDGNDILDGAGGGVAIPLLLNGGEGNDVLLSGPQPTALGWNPGDGTDRLVGGDGPNQVRIFGTDAFLGIHQIRGFLGPGCAFFDFLGGGGVEDAGIDDAVFFPGAGGIDLFVEFECGVSQAQWNGNAGSDRTLFRGTAGGGNRLDLDFELDQSIFTDGFESGDVSSWSLSTDRTAATSPLLGGTLWDGIDYQDWPSFQAPSTSGPSRVVIRGKPDFPVTLDLGPDGGSGRGGAVDSLLVDPLGLPFTDDGSRIVIDGGPPIAYSGVEVVRVGAPTAAAEEPDGGAPTLSVFPNPTVGGGRVRLEAPGRAEARVVVLDVLAREVAVLHDGPLAGAREWRLSEQGIAPGVYVVVAHGAGWVVSQRMVVAE